VVEDVGRVFDLERGVVAQKFNLRPKKHVLVVVVSPHFGHAAAPNEHGLTPRQELVDVGHGPRIELIAGLRVKSDVVAFNEQRECVVAIMPRNFRADVGGRQEVVPTEQIQNGQLPRRAVEVDRV